MNNYDSSLWDEEIRDVSPLSNQRKNLHLPAGRRIIVNPATAHNRSMHHAFRGPTAGQHFDSLLLKRLKTGRVQPEAILDMHEMTTTTAYEALIEFISNAYTHHYRCVLVITGKGRVSEHGVLKRALPQWCAEAPIAGLIIGLHTAHKQHGGQGASYIQLSRRR